MVAGIDDIAWVTLGAELVKVANDEGWIKNLRTAARRRHHVLLVGATGVGKTQLRRSLTNSVNEAVLRSQRTQTTEKTKPVKISDLPFVFYDTPGDEDFDGERLRAFQEHAKRKRIGIINVVSNGYRRV